MDYTSWYFSLLAKTTTGAGPKVFYAIHLVLLNNSHIYNNTVSNWKASCQLFSVPLICSVRIIILQTKRTLNMPTFYHSDETKAQLLGSRIKQWNLLEKGVIVSLYRKRQWDIATRFLTDGNPVYCNNGQWKHFTDSSKVSLKAVLLHNGSKFHSIPLARAVHVKETYKNLQVLLQKYIWRTLVEYMCQPQSYSNADWAA